MDDRQLNILLVEDDQVDVMNVQRAFNKCHIGNPLKIAGNGVDDNCMGGDRVVAVESDPETEEDNGSGTGMGTGTGTEAVAAGKNVLIVMIDTLRAGWPRTRGSASRPDQCPTSSR